MAITWGSIVGGYGKIGYEVTQTTSNDNVTTIVKLYFASKYSVSDSSNILYYDKTSSASSAKTNRGAITINTTVDSPGWSSSNQVELKTYSYENEERTTSEQTRYFYAKFANVDRVGGTMYVSGTYKIPALAKYTIKYNANGGSSTPSTQTKYYGRDITLAAAISKSGYTFSKWKASSTGTTYPAKATYSTNANETFIAQWTANTYTITYNVNGGTGTVASTTQTHGSTATLSTTIPTRTNYSFLGWSTLATATVAEYESGGSYSANQSDVLYAVWKLAYVRPRMTTPLTLYRCDGDGVESDSGTNARVIFSYECDSALSSIVISYKTSSGTATSVTLSNTSQNGSVDYIISNTLSLESTYNFTITITDASGHSTFFATLNGSQYTLDFLAGGNGAAFGKPAELEGVLDIQYKTRLLGGLSPVYLDPETDLNNVTVPGTYTGADLSSYAYVNCPVSSGTFTLLVESCGDDGQLKQTYCKCSKIIPQRFVRFYYQDAWGAWMWANTDEYVLYNNTSGHNGTITLNQSVANYRYIEIYFTDNTNKTGGYTKVYSPSGKTVCLNITESSASGIYSRQTQYTVSGTTLTPNTTNASYYRTDSDAGMYVLTGTNYLKIIRVVGRA